MVRPISIKLDEDTIETLDAEADERDLTRSQYLRRIIDARHEQETQDDLVERVQRLEEAVMKPATDGSSAPAPELHSEEELAPEPEVTDEIAEVVDDAAATWTDDRDRIEARKEAAYAVLEALRDRPRSKSEIIEEFYPKYPVKGQSERTWWRKNLAEGSNAPIKELAEYSNSTKKWTWTG